MKMTGRICVPEAVMTKPKKTSDVAAIGSYDLVYLSTPYTKYPGGMDEAFVRACQIAGELIRHGVNIYSPIAHTHPISKHAELDKPGEFWLKFDLSILDKADALLVAKMPTWEDSVGVKVEIDHFLDACKPVYYLDPL